MTRRQRISELKYEARRTHKLVQSLVSINTSLLEENDILRDENWKMDETLRKGGYMATTKTTKKTIKKAAKKNTVRRGR